MKPNQQTSLADWIDWLLALHAQEIDLGLTRIKRVADRLALLPLQSPVISVAGTNGKGSSVAMLQSIYQSAGYQVGAYTSPHLLRFNERFQINGTSVSDADIVSAFHQIEVARGDTKLTFFEFATLAALLIFKAAKLDIIVLEVGLGGRLDAVNIVDANLALITAIGVDHTDWLGSDINQIAIEKAGIMRSNKLSVCSDPNVPTRLIEYATQQQVKLHRLGQDFFIEALIPPEQSSNSLNLSQNYQAWSLKTRFSDSFDLPLPALKGDFQVQNASGVVASVILMASELPVTSLQIETGLRKAKHPGRLEVLNYANQEWLMDVAHNPQSAEVLASYLSNNRACFDVSIFSALADKDVSPMICAIKPFVKKWRIADLGVPRAMSVDELQQVFCEVGVSLKDVEVFNNLKEAVIQTREEASDIHSVMAWGSFFTISQVMAVPLVVDHVT